MTFEQLTAPFPWKKYSRKLKSKIQSLHNAGFFTPKASQERGVRMVVGASGAVADGNAVQFYWLVDREDGSIVDAKYQVFGQSALIGAAESVCELLVGKNYDQAGRISGDLIDKHVRDRSDQEAFPAETHAHINIVLEAIEDASQKCTDIPLPTEYVAPPAPLNVEVLEGGYPGWDELALKEQVALVESVIDTELRPYIALDGGGVVVLDLKKGRELIIQYEGSCTSCYSAVGTTLSYIQQVLRAKIHPELVVTPDIDETQFF